LASTPECFDHHDDREDGACAQQNSSHGASVPLIGERWKRSGLGLEGFERVARTLDLLWRLTSPVA
jgi:hypothetical protein